MISHYLVGLNQAITIRAEMGVARLFNLEDARQYPLNGRNETVALWNKETDCRTQ